MIRKAVKEDIDAILNITKACAAYMIEHGIFQWNEHYPNRLAFEKDVARNELFVLEVDNEIRGCIVISTLMDDEYQSIKWLTKTKIMFTSTDWQYIQNFKVKVTHSSL